MKSAVFEKASYTEFLNSIKSRITQARIHAASAVNRELISLYWSIGKEIVQKQEKLGWGKSVVEKLSKDLRKEFPGTSGFSARNLWDMRRFYEEYCNHKKLRQLVAEIPWGQNLLILQKLKDDKAREYYLKATANYGWSRNVLLNQIKAHAYQHALKEGKTSNFNIALPEYLAQQAEEALKSSYNLEFLGIKEDVHERHLESQLIEKLKNFILELGYGFCFIGSQYKLKLGKNEYFLDLLFYHRFLKSLVAIELKTGKFKPEYAGKMDFYLNLLNEQEKADDDKPSLGIILCAERDRLEVEFALRTKVNPIGVAEYKLYHKLPGSLKGKLPSSKQLMQGLK
ncbi:MAG: DUF1016 domain-containing protein [Deltaproteobacteria bacterium CG_4_10_14_0_2_um_filter_43_8]|nr:MAG: hypothetical protein COV43_08390 [Deltaproteobacteria bacterium CG11_big_fil_rev_8_21_14_0_20_42_23]PJA21080.1 MAG: DUF1016 domain-containing protein [Deltaproteobacteria bacterium CG_4_10_14_0_2_um_filter_43_8]PJC63692.1 MAG: DUF1016 domain-containing protein [Deltaproteobacteria bacterium CG_4_9_14_0_2_um_filter_42_21]